MHDALPLSLRLEDFLSNTKPAKKSSIPFDLYFPFSQTHGDGVHSLVSFLIALIDELVSVRYHER